MISIESFNQSWSSKSNYDCTIYLPINLVCWSSSSPSVVFPLTCCRSEPPLDAFRDASVSSSSSSYRPPLAMIRSSLPRLPCSDLSIIEPWWLHLDIFQKSSSFTLKQICTFLLSSSSWFLHRTPSWYLLLLNLEHSSLERTPSALIPFVVTELILSDTNYACITRNIILWYQ